MVKKMLVSPEIIINALLDIKADCDRVGEYKQGVVSLLFLYYGICGVDFEGQAVSIERPIPGKVDPYGIQARNGDLPRVDDLIVKQPLKVNAIEALREETFHDRVPVNRLSAFRPALDPGNFASPYIIYLRQTLYICNCQITALGESITRGPNCGSD